MSTETFFPRQHPAFQIMGRVLLKRLPSQLMFSRLNEILSLFISYAKLNAAEGLNITADWAGQCLSQTATQDLLTFAIPLQQFTSNQLLLCINVKGSSQCSASVAEKRLYQGLWNTLPTSNDQDFA
jgi:hypothetical protein